MEKLIVKIVVILGLTFSYHAMSGTYWACAGGPCNTGTFNSGSGNASSGNLGAFMPGYVQGSGMGGGPSAADMAAKAQAEQDQKKKYCKENNYPTVVPFCAGFKEAEQKRQACVANAESTGQSCKNAYNTLLKICSTYTGMLGGAAVSKFLSWIAIEEKGLSAAISIGAATVGYSESIVSCDGLAPMAMNYCDVGSVKMKERCN